MQTLKGAVGWARGGQAARSGADSSEGAVQSDNTNNTDQTLRHYRLKKLLHAATILLSLGIVAQRERKNKGLGFFPLIFYFFQFFCFAGGAAFPGSSRSSARAPRPSHSAHGGAHTGLAGTGRAHRPHSPFSRRPPGPAVSGKARPAASCAWSGQGRQSLARSPGLRSPSAAAASAATAARPVSPRPAHAQACAAAAARATPPGGARAVMSPKVIPCGKGERVSSGNPGARGGRTASCAPCAA